MLLLRRCLLLLALLIIGSCANQPVPPPAQFPLADDDAVFPAPPGLQPQITFWQNVYAKWGMGQVALHDNRYMDLIYEVVELPGTVNEGYSVAQKVFLRMRYEALKDTLRDLEMKVASRAPLSAHEQQLAGRIQSSSGGAGALVGASERLRSQRGLRERFKEGLEISGRYDAAFRQEFRQAGLPEDLAYLPHVESSFQNHAASSVGAVGMWQFMPGTAKQFMMMNKAVDERRDPVASAQGAARYLGKAHGRLQSWPLAITSYNHGVGGMARAKSMWGDDIASIVKNHSGKGFGFASRNFYAEFLAARSIARNPQHFFPEGLHYHPPLDLERVRLRQAVPVQTVARYYGVSTGELVALNRAWNPVAQNGQIALPQGTMVWLPPGTMMRLAQSGATDRALALGEPLSSTRLR